MTFLSTRALDGLRQYKYKPAGYTVIDDWHQPIWNYIAQHVFPDWLAPNLITLTGLMALIASYLITAYYNIDFQREVPHWTYLFAALAVFFYLHMDALDGKQARRTGTSSPLGQLFDHGCDAMAVHLILVTLITSLQLEHNWKAVIGVLYVFVPWWMAHWEEYHTGIMVYGSGLWGVTEANYAVTLVHLYTYILGPVGWTYKPLKQACASGKMTSVYMKEYACTYGSELGVNDILLLAFGFMGASLFLQQVLRVFRLSGSKQLLKTTLPQDERGDKALGKANALLHLLQILWTCLGGGLVLMLPLVPTIYSRIVFATFGINYALQATRMIMAHMTKEPFEIAAWPSVLLGSQVVNYYLPFMDPVILSVLVLGGMVIGYLHYVLSVISQICEFLGIKALTIPTQAKKKA